MASSSRNNRYAALHHPLTAGDHRLHYSSPFHNHRLSPPPSSAFASSSVARSPIILPRSTSPTRVSLSSASPKPSVRFSIDSRPVSPHRQVAVSPASKPVTVRTPSRPRRTCMCSPTTHPGSFRCALHKNAPGPSAATSNRLYARRSAMTNSLVRIGTVEGDLVRRALAALIRPSSHQQRRRAAFQPGPSRLSVMSRSDD